jgi:large subunit ribosomal protein L29
MPFDVKDLRENTLPELEKQLRDTREELLKSRLSKQTGQLERPHLLKEYRRDIARLETLIIEKKRAAAAS